MTRDLTRPEELAAMAALQRLAPTERAALLSLMPAARIACVEALEQPLRTCAPELAERCRRWRETYYRGATGSFSDASGVCAPVVCAAVAALSSLDIETRARVLLLPFSERLDGLLALDIDPDALTPPVRDHWLRWRSGHLSEADEIRALLAEAP